MLASIEELPHSSQVNNWGTSLLNAPLWNDSDLRTLANLAAKAGPEYAGRLALVVNNLEWIRAQLLIVRAEDPRLGYALSNFPWEHYVQRRAHIAAELGNVRTNAAESAMRVSPT